MIRDLYVRRSKDDPLPILSLVRRDLDDAAFELDPATAELDEGQRFPMCRPEPLPSFRHVCWYRHASTFADRSDDQETRIWVRGRAAIALGYEGACLAIPGVPIQLHNAP